MSEPSNVAERRVFPRIPLLSEAWIIETDGTRTHVRTRDLSKGGLCLEVEGEPWGHGQLLELRLRLPDQPEELELKGFVAWSTKSAMGIQFESIDPEMAQLIDATIERILDELESLEQAKTPT